MENKVIDLDYKLYVDICSRMASLFVSIVASALSIGATVPQILKILRRGETNDLSLAALRCQPSGHALGLLRVMIEKPVLAFEATLVFLLNTIVVVHIVEQSTATAPLAGATPAFSGPSEAAEGIGSGAFALFADPEPMWQTILVRLFTSS